MLPEGSVEDYGGRETFVQRAWMYDWAHRIMHQLGLEDGDRVVDVGAGNCDLDLLLRKRDWFGRYVPIDSMIDGTDLETWEPFPAEFYVCIDTLEHIRDWEGLVERMKAAAIKGVMVATPDANTVDVLAMHESHQSALVADDLREHGFAVVESSLSGYIQLMGFWATRWTHRVG